MASVWMKSSDGQRTDDSGEDENEDIWDDTALIQAYEKAVNSFKKSKNGEEHAFKDPKMKKKQRKNSHKNNNGNKEKNHWKIGDKCQALYSEDGLLYIATITEIDAKNRNCVVQFDYYDNIETVNFDDLYDEYFGAKQMNDTQMKDNFRKLSEDKSFDNWSVGDICIAYNPKSRKHEEAVIIGLLHNHNKCDLTFIKSKNKQTIKISSIRGIKSSQQSNHCSCIHQNRDEERKFQPQYMFPNFGSQFHHISSEPCMPPMPPPFPFPSFPLFPQQNYQDSNRNTMPSSKRFNPLIPPPPPPLPFPCQFEDGDESALANMLISWYMVGYHTGYYQAMTRDSEKVVASNSTNNEMKECESTLDSSNNSDL